MRRYFSLFVTLLLGYRSLAQVSSTCAIDPTTVQAYSYVTSSNSICIIWPTNYLRTQIWIDRRVYTNKPSAWASFSNIYSDTTATAKNASQYCDQTVSNAVHYEYRIGTAGTNWSCDGGVTTNLPPLDFQYINAGINVPANLTRGNLELLIDSSVNPSIGSSIQTLTNDLIGDGYKVFLHTVAPVEVTNSPIVAWAQAVTNTRNLVITDYNTDPTADWTLFIIGHVPIPYSGQSSPGGHNDNIGAHPCDWYYADTNSANWTDSTVNDTSATFASMNNVPGDGKWDQSNVPGIPQMRVGRVDLTNMSSFSQTQVQLLQQYLLRDHQWRNKQFTVRERGLCITNGTPFESHNLYASYFGSNTNEDLGQWFKAATNSANSYLFAMGTGSGEYDRDDNVGFSTNLNIGQQKAYTTNFAATPIYAVFDSTFGSYYGDWDSGIHSNVSQAVLANAGYGLTETYRETTLPMDSTSMGEPIGQETYALVANFYPPFTARYFEKGNFSAGTWTTNTFLVHGYVSLLGDPTLKSRVVMPPTNVFVRSDNPDRVISWNPSTDTGIQGYHVYRAPTANLNQFTRLTAIPTNSPYRDASIPTGTNYTYWVRAVKLEQPGMPSRTFYNASVGSFSPSTLYTNYYVATNGSDSNLGTSVSPFLTVQKAFNVARAGDVIYLTQGRYQERVLTQRAGSAGLPITLDGQGVGSLNIILVENAYINLINTTFLGTNTANASYFVWMDKGSAAADYCVLSNNVFDGQYVDTNSFQHGNSGGILRWNNPSPPTETPFGGHCASGCLVISNEFKRIAGTVVVGSFGDTNIFYGNYLHDCNTVDWWHTWGRTNYVVANVCSNCYALGGLGWHPDCFQIGGENGAGAIGGIIESNLFIDGSGDMQICMLEGHDVDNTNWDLTFRNNLFVRIPSKGTMALPNVKWYNNTFVQCATNTLTAAYVFIFTTETNGVDYTNFAASTGHGGRVLNNVFYNCGDGVTNKDYYNFYTYCTNVIADYNFGCYTNNFAVVVDGAHRAVGDPGGWSGGANSAWWEPHGINGGNPQLAADYTVGTNSFLYQAGTNLSSIFTVDKVGYTRPASTAWTIGAYEVNTGLAPAPANFTITFMSTNPASGVNITLSPTSLDPISSGNTTFTALYASNATVTATAPATASGAFFNEWYRDGTAYTNNPVATFVADQNRTFSVAYTNTVGTFLITFTSTTPNSGVAMTVSPTSNDSTSSGNTTFSATWNSTTNVTVTAPNRSQGSSFLQWNRDGVYYTNNVAAVFSVDRARTFTAQYWVTPPQISISGSTKVSGNATIQ